MKKEDLGNCSVNITTLLDDYRGEEVTPQFIIDSIGYFRIELSGILKSDRIIRILQFLEKESLVSQKKYKRVKRKGRSK